MSFPLHLVPKTGVAASPELLVHGALEELPDPGLALTLSTGIDMAELQAFSRLMEAQGLPLQPTRMIYDRLYAFDCLTLAHGSGNDALQRMALHIFDAYQARGEWIGLMH
ncbi:MAG TPA: hypothetical protein VK195_08400 [Burkholderiaceae bacterium]|nr:hypothetical protein [Burkholderiaceae bacterium]